MAKDEEITEKVFEKIKPKHRPRRRGHEKLRQDWKTARHYQVKRKPDL